MAIWASFGVLCLAAALLVVWTTQDCSGMLAAPVAPSPEPFPGAHAALTPLGSRECSSTGGPTVGPTGAVAGGVAARSLVEGVLEGRGYVPAGGTWDEPAPLPRGGTAAGLEGSCGLVALVAEPGGWVARTRRGSGAWRDSSCSQALALVPACEGDGWDAEGTGAASARAFVMPGLTAATAESTGLPLDVLLAHGEAEVTLRAHRWEPADEVVARDVRATTAGPFSEAPPAAPPRGCIGWVAVGRGLGSATTYWSHFAVDSDPAQHGFTLGLIACAPDPAAAITETRLELMDDDGGGGRIWYRPYAPASGPSVPGAGAAAPRGIGSMRAVDRPPSALPDPVPASDGH